MWWAMLAQGGLSAIKEANEAKYRERQTRRINEAMEKADYATVANAGQAISAMNVQNGQLRVEAARQLNEAEVAAYAATGSAVANAAAAGVKGASVDAVVNDIDRELADAKTSIEQNLEIQQYNLVNRIREITTGAANALRGQINPYEGSSGSPLLSGLMQVGAGYLNNYMQFGGGFGNNASSDVQTFGAPDTAAGMTFTTGT